MKKIILYETADTHFLLPLTYYKHCAELKIGIFSIEEKWRRAGFKVERIGRYYLNKDTETDSKDYLYVSSRLLPNQKIFDLLFQIKTNEAISYGDKIIGFRTTKKATRDKDGFVVVQSADFTLKILKEVSYLRYPWDIVLYNPDEIKSDIKRVNHDSKKTFENVVLINESQIFIASDTIIYPGVVINAEKGPVFIDRNVKISANCYLEGPLYIGTHTEIKPLSKIQNSSIHHTCKAGGEISGSVMFEFCNKGHDGFLGSSVLGSWTNIGAGSNTSNLKNNYGLVEMHYFNERIKTDTQYLGTIFGDHSKSAIQTRFNTGTIVGIQSNVFENTIPPKWISSFSWGNSGNERYDLDKSIDTSRTVMARRNSSFDLETEKLFKNVYEYALKMEKL